MHAGLHAYKALISYCSQEIVYKNLETNIDPLLACMSHEAGKIRLVVSAILQKVCELTPNLVL